MIRKRTLLTSGNGGGGGATAAPLSIVLASKSDDSLKIVEGGDWSASAYPSSSWEPVGVVVIPGTHGYIKDGDGTTNQCAMISIVPMSYSTPETGGTSEGTMYWGGYGTDISGKSDGLGRYDSYSGDGLRNYHKVAVTAKKTSNTASGLSKSSYAYIPRQAAIGGTPTRNYDPFAPSPYNGSDYKSGEYNDSYGTTSFDSGSNYNVLADVRGIVNTKIITDMATAESWKTLSSLTNSDSSGYYPAACCCARYHTRGTKAFKGCTDSELKAGTGFWYMPSAGELGYILPRLYDINDTISKLNASYGVGVQLATSSSFWSSSEYSSGGAYRVGTDDGYVNGLNKGNNRRVRALCRL